MNVLRKLILAILGVAVVLGGIFLYINISNRHEKENAEIVMNEFLKSIKEGNLTRVGELTYIEPSNEEASNEIETNELNKSTEAFSDNVIKALLKDLSYEYEIVDDVTIFNNEVNVNVRIINKNMKEIISKASTEMLKYTFSSLFNMGGSSGSAEDKFQELLLEAVDSEDINYSNNRFSLKLVKVDKEWKVKITNESEFVNAIFPELQDAIIKYKVGELYD